jgi:XRE family transcriptional regulator, fatty acid utilization regulator
LLRRALGLHKASRFEDAMEAGERFVAEFKLGDVPAAKLAQVMERDLGILVLHVDAFDGISGAACRLPELDVVLINRREVVGRRHFDLAHELFHILTWDAMPPEHSEDAAEISKNRVELLANNFASTVLMPAAVLDGFANWATIPAEELPARLNAAADELLVSASALKWRLVALARLTPATARAIPDAVLRNNGRDAASSQTPLLFSKPFMEVIGLAVDQGRVSARRAAGLLDLSVDELGDLFTAHGVPSPLEL